MRGIKPWQESGRRKAYQASLLWAQGLSLSGVPERLWSIPPPGHGDGDDGIDGDSGMVMAMMAPNTCGTPTWSQAEF